MKLLNNLIDHIQFHAQHRQETMMASDCSKSLNYGQAWQHINRIAARLQNVGIGKGDRVGILAKNSVDNLCVLLACARVGAVAVGINYRLTQDEINYIATDAGIQFLFSLMNLTASGATI